MFEEAGPNIRVCCDYEAQVLRIEENVTAAFGSGFKPTYRETAVFGSAAEFYASPIAVKVTNESVQESITWFWIDMREPLENNTS